MKKPALRAVLHALAMDTPSPDRTLDAEVGPGAAWVRPSAFKKTQVFSETTAVSQFHTIVVQVVRRTLRLLRRIAPPVSLGEGVAAAMQREQEERAAALRG